MSYRHQLIEDELGGLPVSRVMHVDHLAVSPDMSVRDPVEERLLATSHRVFPVVDARGLQGSSVWRTCAVSAATNGRSNRSRRS